MRFVIGLGIFVFAAVVFCEDFICNHGVSYEVNSCNVCTCGGIEYMTCSKQFCPLLNCTVGRTWKKGCNRCWCVALKGPICEMNKCSSPDEPVDIVMESK